MAVTLAKSQFLMDMVDTTKEIGKGMLGMYKKFDHIRLSGYLQPQFQVAESNGAKSFEGPDFGTNVSNRFLLRRSRVKIDYIHFGDEHKPGVQITFQFDANERGFTVRDIWGRIFENKYKLFSFTTGMFARPFGYETNLSSSDRESPERGRMNQLLMKSERDLGAMVSFDARKKIKGLNYLKLDVGFFNGQGINATGEFDNSKDLIGRLALKPYHINKHVTFSAGASVLYGALFQNTKYEYTTEEVGGIKKNIVDSSTTNLNGNAPRHYYGADAQLKIKNLFGNMGSTEFRAEYILGTHSVTQNNNETPTALLTGTDGFYVRKFNGAYFYFIQDLGSSKNQMVVKYDWFDPNTLVKGTEIGAVGSNLTAANIKYSTLGIGYINHITPNAKLVLYYSFVKNENTSLSGYTNDVKDNILTCRLQFRF